MHHSRRVRVLPLAFALALLAPCAQARADESARVLPRGQEQVVLSMLGGRDTVAACVLSGANVEARRIVARYRCEGASEEATVELVVGASDASHSTEHFTLHVRGDHVPAALVEALLLRVRDAEHTIRFASAGEAPSTRRTRTPRPNALGTRGRRATTALLLFGLFVVASRIESGTRRKTAAVVVACAFLACLALVMFGSGWAADASDTTALRFTRASMFTVIMVRLACLTRTSTTTPSSRAPQRAQVAAGAHAPPWRWPLVFFLATLLALALRGEHAPLHSDTASDLLIARDCAERTTCLDAGAVASFGDLRQGALWLHLLEARIRLGLGIEFVEVVAALGIAAASALLAFTAARVFDVTPSPLLWATWLLPTLVTSHYPVLWNPTLLPLALAAFAHMFMLGVRTGRSDALVGAALALAVAVDLHIAMLLLLPFVVAVTVAFAARPATTLCEMSVVLVATLSLDSPGAFSHDVARLMPVAPIATVVIVGVCLVGAALRRRVRIGRPSGPPVLVAAAMVVTLSLALLGLSAVTGRGIESRYLAPVVTPGAILLCALVEPRTTRWVRGALAILAAVAFFVVPLRLPGIGVRDVRPIAAALYERASYTDLYAHLRSPEGFALLSTLPAFEPRRHDAPTLEHDLVVLRTDRDRLPDTIPAHITVIDLDARHVWLIVPSPPRLDVRAMQVCVDEDCTRVAISPDELLRGRDVHGWHALAFPSIGGLVRRFGRVSPDATVTYHLDVLPGVVATRVHILSQHCPGWSIERTPTTHARATDNVLLPADAHGEVVFSATGCGFYGWLPAFGTLPDEPWLSRIVDDSRTPHLRR